MDETTIGKLLTQKREQKSISLKEVADKTKININILRSLEADDLDNLPNKTYVRGFVQNYAKTIGLDIHEATQILNDTYQAQSPEPILNNDSNEEVSPESQSSSLNTNSLNTKSLNSLNKNQMIIRENIINLVHKLFHKKTLISIAALVALIFVTKGLIGFFTKVSNEQVKIKPQVANSKNSATNSTIKGADESLFDIKATKKLVNDSSADSKLKAVDSTESADESADESKNASSAVTVTKTDTTDTEEMKLEAGQVPFKQFYPAPLNMYDVIASAPENVNEELIPINIRESVVADTENVFINATDGDTWISYQSDDNAIKRFVLKKGRHVIIRGKVILLFLGNAKVTKIFYNNQLVKFATRTGVKSLIFPPSQIKNFELPLFPSYNGVPYKQKTYKAKMAKPQ